MFKNVTLTKAIPYLLIIGGIIGLICSFIITQDKMDLAENPHFVPSCNLNPVISCGSVMSSKQGSLFGFPNPWLGLAAFAVLVTIGMAILAGAKFKRWFWLGLETGIVLGVAFAYWLLFESVYRIKALCPYCLTVDVVVITLIWYVTLYNIQEGHITLPARLIGVGDFARKHHLDILLTWFILLIAVILQHFWYYYGQYL
jgi:uncharacterized membrane protein